MESSHQFIATWVLFIKLLDSTMKQKKYHEKAPIIKKKILGEENCVAATSYNN